MKMPIMMLILLSLALKHLRTCIACMDQETHF